ncbi:LPS export ABC transporter periplasmic protein LptC [Celeribacter sp.]|uniref:LPS export ABC transporter periplasmic protein LptC n=1 Tax=Celeribacter sp. TaxID=1890673 RepID=UPI003A90562A
MARYNNKHSRIVAMAKIVLPLMSLALLATLFLFARGGDYEPSLPYARIDIETLAREQRIDGPAFATVTKDGSELYLSAAAVRPDLSGSNTVNSTTIEGGLRMPDNGTLDLLADNAVIDGQSKIAELSGGVEITTSTGYVVTTERIAAMLDTTQVESSGAVHAIGPLGTFDAGRMILSQDKDTGNYLLVFKDSVKLIYQPKEIEGRP